MAWKMRKDKLKAGAPDGDAATEAETPAPTPEAATEEAGQTPVFDLSGSAFQPQPAPTEDEPLLPQFPVDAPAAPTFALEPIALAPPRGTQGVADTTSGLTDDLEPLPEFDSTVAPSVPSLEPEAIAIAPPPPSAETEVAEVPEAEDIEDFEAPAPEVPEISPQREALASGLVSTETETGLPRVAPFILDTPPAPAETVPTEPKMHTIVIRIGRMSANYFLTKDVTTIGRPDSVVQNYPDIEIDLDDGVSRRHAEIRDDGEGYTITDVGSTNGTLLNGAPLTPDQAVVLQSGDRIRVGERTELLFE